MTPVDPPDPERCLVAANDNGDPGDRDATTSAERLRKSDALVLSIARLIGRQLAREHFETLRATNDNAPPPHDDEEAGDDDGR